MGEASSCFKTDWCSAVGMFFRFASSCFRVSTDFFGCFLAILIPFPSTSLYSQWTLPSGLQPGMRECLVSEGVQKVALVILNVVKNLLSALKGEMLRSTQHDK